ncbi:hypothetical protein HELRODRAFT_170413 [Helobdella robusta]|uniref:Uncharacterized protein n=1 Tax=Helobdella robusta TaxID=6412 RepID=T1F309_HELRO|nr:hypothetical protein HELRODRAFT_170413 [Helobdella robusta]ESO07113.1 hypothetical protein HELRODRAFT_170413 [Helobdella robusta]
MERIKENLGKNKQKKSTGGRRRSKSSNMIDFNLADSEKQKTPENKKTFLQRSSSFLSKLGRSLSPRGRDNDLRSSGSPSAGEQSSGGGSSLDSTTVIANASADPDSWLNKNDSPNVKNNGGLKAERSRLLSPKFFKSHKSKSSKAASKSQKNNEIGYVDCSDELNELKIFKSTRSYFPSLISPPRDDFAFQNSDDNDVIQNGNLIMENFDGLQEDVICNNNAVFPMDVEEEPVEYEHCNDHKIDANVVIKNPSFSDHRQPQTSFNINRQPTPNSNIVFRHVIGGRLSDISEESCVSDVRMSSNPSMDVIKEVDDIGWQVQEETLVQNDVDDDDEDEGEERKPALNK